MKKLIIFVILIVVFVHFSCINDSGKISVENEPYSIYTEIKDGIFFERLNATEHSIFFAENADADCEDRQYIIEDKLIFRYGYCDGYIAYHWNDLTNGSSKKQNTRSINSVDYTIKNDSITIFDTKSNKRYNFSNQDEFNDYCINNDIYFEWRFSNGFELNNVAKLNKKSAWEINKFTSRSLTGFVVKDNKTLFEGYISDVYYDNNVIMFRLQIPSTDLLEFRDLSFDELDVSFEKPIGKYKISLLLLYEDIYYDSYIIINGATDEVMQFRNKTEAEEMVSQISRENQSGENQSGHGSMIDN